MVDSSVKQQQQGSVKVTTCDLGTLAAAIGLTRRRMRAFALGFALAFAVFTAFLALAPASPGNSSPFFSGLVLSNSNSSHTAQQQISSIFFRFFRNSSSSVSPVTGKSDQDLRFYGSGITGFGVEKNKSNVNAVGSKIEPKVGVFFNTSQSRSGLSAVDTVVIKKNLTGSEVTESGSMENGILKQNGTGIGVTDSGMDQNGVLGRDQSKNGVGSGGSGSSVKNGNGNGLAKNVAVAGNQSSGVVGGNGVAKDNKSDKVGGISTQRNQTVLGVSTKGTANVSALNGNGVQVKKTNNDQESNSQSTGVPGNNQSGFNGAKGSNFTASLMNGSNTSVSSSSSATDDNKKMSAEKSEGLIKGLVGCNIFHGKWVKDDSYPLYPEGSCPHIDEPFDCYSNGRPDRAYQKLRWQPVDCKIPRLNATDMLERLRGKRLVFVGDSLNRNMWESLVCILRNSVKEKTKVFEASGRREFRTEGSYSFLFTDYNCSVEFFRSPFLVQEWEMSSNNGTKKETLRLDLIEGHSSKYKDADIIVFNTGHWWTHEKTSRGKDYYQEGNHVYGELNVVDAFHKALSTWAKWVDHNVNPKKTFVYFRGYSASHFSGGQWNSGGACDKETEPIKEDKYLGPYPPKMNVLESVIKGMEVPVSYLNITRMTDYRKDAHPSVYRKQNLTEEERRAPEKFQDCSHWCLPGVPDSWNELLYAQLIIKQEKLQEAGV